MKHQHIYDLCKQHMHSYVLAETKDGKKFDGILTGLDEEYAYFAVPIDQGNMSDYSHHQGTIGHKQGYPQGMMGHIHGHHYHHPEMMGNMTGHHNHYREMMDHHHHHHHHPEMMNHNHQPGMMNHNHYPEIMDHNHQPGMINHNHHLEMMDHNHGHHYGNYYDYHRGDSTTQTEVNQERYGFPGYGYYPPRRFSRLVLPLAALVALSAIPWY